MISNWRGEGRKGEEVILPAVEIFSFVTYGKLISGSTRENGRLFGEIVERYAPIPAVKRTIIQSKKYEAMRAKETRPDLARYLRLPLIIVFREYYFRIQKLEERK